MPNGKRDSDGLELRPLPTFHAVLEGLRAIDPNKKHPTSDALASVRIRQAEALTLIGLELHHLRRAVETLASTVAGGFDIGGHTQPSSADPAVTIYTLDLAPSVPPGHNPPPPAPDVGVDRG